MFTGFFRLCAFLSVYLRVLLCVTRPNLFFFFLFFFFFFPSSLCVNLFAFACVRIFESARLKALVSHQSISRFPLTPRSDQVTVYLLPVLHGKKETKKETWRPYLWGVVIWVSCSFLICRSNLQKARPTVETTNEPKHLYSLLIMGLSDSYENQSWRPPAGQDRDAPGVLI